MLSLEIREKVWDTGRNLETDTKTTDETKGKKAGALVKWAPVFYRLTRYCYDKFWKR